VRLALQGISIAVPIPELQEDIFLEKYGWTHQEYMKTPYRVICSLSTIIEERSNIQREMQEQQEREMEVKRSMR